MEWLRALRASTGRSFLSSLDVPWAWPTQPTIAPTGDNGLTIPILPEIVPEKIDGWFQMNLPFGTPGLFSEAFCCLFQVVHNLRIHMFFNRLFKGG